MILPLHHVKCLVQSLFSGKEHFVDADSTSFAIVGTHNRIKIDELLPEGLLRSDEHSSCIFDGIAHISQLLIDLAGVAWNLELFTREGIGDFGNSFLKRATIPNHNNVDTSLDLISSLLIRFVWRSEDKGLTSGSSEEESLQSSDVG